MHQTRPRSIMTSLPRGCYAPVAQWIEYRPPKPGAGVRVSPGVPSSSRRVDPIPSASLQSSFRSLGSLSFGQTIGQNAVKHSPAEQFYHFLHDAKGGFPEDLSVAASVIERPQRSVKIQPLAPRLTGLGTQRYVTGRFRLHPASVAGNRPTPSGRTATIALKLSELWQQARETGHALYRPRI